MVADVVYQRQMLFACAATLLRHCWEVWHKGRLALTCHTFTASAKCHKLQVRDQVRLLFSLLIQEHCPCCLLLCVTAAAAACHLPGVCAIHPCDGAAPQSFAMAYNCLSDGCVFCIALPTQVVAILNSALIVCHVCQSMHASFVAPDRVPSQQGLWGSSWLHAACPAVWVGVLTREGGGRVGCALHSLFLPRVGWQCTDTVCLHCRGTQAGGPHAGAGIWRTRACCNCVVYAAVCRQKRCGTCCARHVCGCVVQHASECT